MVSVMLATGTSPAQVNEEMLLSDITHLRLLAGIRPSALTQEEALGYTFTGREEDILGKRRNRQAIGTAAEVETTLDDLLRATEVDELMFQMVGATDTGRQQSLATVMELARRNALHA